MKTFTLAVVALAATLAYGALAIAPPAKKLTVERCCGGDPQLECPPVCPKRPAND